MANPSAATFIIVILVLVGLGLAFAMNVYFTRRQSRAHLENVIRLSFPSPSPPAAEPPGLWEVWIRRATDEKDWGSLMPICATQIPYSTPILSRQPTRKNSMPFTTPTALSSTASTPPPLKNSAAQVAVLISMPSFPHDRASYVSASTNHLSDNTGGVGVFPDVMLGISTLVCQGDHGSRL